MRSVTGIALALVLEHHAAQRAVGHGLVDQIALDRDVAAAQRAQVVHAAVAAAAPTFIA